MIQCKTRAHPLLDAKPFVLITFAPKDYSMQWFVQKKKKKKKKKNENFPFFPIVKWLQNMFKSIPSRHMTLIQRRLNVDATS